MKTFFSYLNGFRKLFICTFIVILATIFLVSGHIDGAMYTKIMTVTPPAYFAGNVGEHTVDAIKEFIKEKYKNYKEDKDDK